MPILALGQIADNDSLVTLGKTKGWISDEITSEIDTLIKAYGVCFIKIKVDPKLLEPPPFQRQGP